MTIYKVPMTLTINCVVVVEAGSPDGALTDIKTMLEFAEGEFEDCEGLLFDVDSGIEVTDAKQVGQPSFGAVEEAPDQREGDGTEEEPEPTEDNSAPETAGEATPPTNRDLK